MLVSIENLRFSRIHHNIYTHNMQIEFQIKHIKKIIVYVYDEENYCLTHLENGKFEL